ncbi:MAG: 30S ribosomal protein S6--L-glutamate ligase [Planctomycetes bacterium]|nr:30S ribosomal protein S6--L-glutamate ligase [Planctomycetota bacterium]
MTTPKIAILSSPDAWHVADLLRAAGTRKLSLEIADPEKLRVDCPGRPGSPQSIYSGKLELTRLDALLVRSIPGGSLEQVIYRMDVLQSLQAAGVVVINKPKAVEVAVDKYLCLSRLRDAGLPVPRTLVCEDPEEAMEAFKSLDGRALIKPLFGSEGRGILRPGSREEARNAIREISSCQGVFYLQEYIDHGGSDLRLLVIGDEVVASMRRKAPPGQWLTNIARGGTAEPLAADEALELLAIEAARAVGAEIAGVDILEDPGGAPRILEVNAIPGWRALSEVSGKDLALSVLDYASARAGEHESEPAGALQP